ncbi:autotransporter outer membrane beta-barrel domain-containing protein [Gluconacetobacter diazotrophicus]|uniref:autotransporter outer membrane beta-barrel domain-containing protein n=1 Tax=Gluconacetobacter diazotrophicus TaxID=33996 RepID=UPI00287BAF65|nr:autotransporter domain-containing protein [Gluconacetobacter diazotrophicus]
MTVGSGSANSSTVQVSGIQFSNTTGSYKITGGTIETAAPQIIIKVGSGSQNGSSVSAEIDSIISDKSVVGGSTLIKEDQGTLRLNAANTYSGGTNIDAGTVVAGNSGAFGSGVVSLAPNTVLIFAAPNLAMDNHLNLSGDPTIRVASGTDTISGAISDGSAPGYLEKTGSGTLILTGSNTYTGGTNVVAGTLQGNANSLQGVIENASRVVFDQDSAGSYSGAMSGTGELDKLGGGTLTLSGESQDSGLATIDAGTMAVNGSYAGGIAVMSGATLSGSGAVGSTTVAYGGTISPGGEHGNVLTVNGDLAIAPGGTYRTDVSPALAGDLLHVNGTASIAGATISLVSGNGQLPSRGRELLLSATNGVNGTFAVVESNFAFLNMALTYQPGDVYLTVQRNGVSLSEIGNTRDEVAVGAALNNLAAGPAYEAALGLSATVARHAFNTLSGESHASARSVLVQDSYYVRDAAVERLRGVECAPGAASGMKTAAGGKLIDGVCQPDKASVWMQDYGSFGHNGGNGNAAGIGHTASGFVLGADAPVAGWQVGGLVGYGHSSFESGAVSSYGHSSNVSLGLYAGTHWGRLALRTGATYSWNMLSTTRNVGFTGFSNRLNTDYNGGTAQAFGDLGYRFDAGPAMIEPFADVAYVNLHTNGYIEHGGPAALAGRATDTGVTYSTFGARVAGTVRVGGIALTPNATLGYRHAFGLTTPTTREAFLAGGNAFDVAGVPLSTDAAVLKAGLQARLTDRLNVGVSYVGQYGDYSTESGVTGAIRIKF